MNPEDIGAILKANQDKEFVRRVLEPALYPRRQNPNGSYSTHLMGSAELDGKGIAFPTLVHDPQAAELRSVENPVREAVRTGEYIEFPTPQAAEDFANNKYKAGLGAGRAAFEPNVANWLWR